MATASSRVLRCSCQAGSQHARNTSTTSSRNVKVTDTIQASKRRHGSHRWHHGDEPVSVRYAESSRCKTYTLELRRGGQRARCATLLSNEALSFACGVCIRTHDGQSRSMARGLQPRHAGAAKSPRRSLSIDTSCNPNQDRRQTRNCHLVRVCFPSDGQCTACMTCAQLRCQLIIQELTVGRCWLATHPRCAAGAKQYMESAMSRAVKAI